jgi:nitrogen fixation/metabolism regulation signal transduction histidine kinase
MNRLLSGPIPLVALSVLLVAAILMLSAAAQHSELFGEYFSVLLAVNALGILALLVLIFANVYRLVRQLRAKTLGSRLTLRVLVMVILLVLTPISIVYYLSVEFINKGIDSWFDDQIEQALDDALMLGRTSLETIKKDNIIKVKELALTLSDAQYADVDLVREVDELREQEGFGEMTLFSQTGRIIASSSAEPDRLIPDSPGEPALLELRKGNVYANIEPAGDEGLILRVVVPVVPRDVSQPLRILQVLQPLPLRYTKLGESVQSAFAEYEKLVYLRDPLKFSLVLTLSLVTLLTLLIAVWVAFYVSRRLTAPLAALADGTRAVAAGDYRKQLPVMSNDELGVLVESFNEMTRQINRAQAAVRRSQREAEEQRAYLETVLAHLSSGVLSFDSRHRLQPLNSSAGQILRADLGAYQGGSLQQLTAAEPRLEPLCNALDDAMAQGASEWQCEVALHGPRGRQVLLCRGSRLPVRGSNRGGYVVVFDDITALIQGQRDAAWAEVARRLAHEIKNPLTPIQLSAERIRHKYLAKLEGRERETLDRATRTIAEQVETMKTMVNAFSSYAQPKQMQPESLDLNALVQDVVELHKDSPVSVRLELARKLPIISADRGRMRQVLNNLVINSRDALRNVADPKLEISTREAHEGGARYIELRVQDNGPGFPAELMDRIFEPYVTTKEKGNGLGLAIVKRIVEEHGGALWAENPQRGGARITLRLPFDEAAAAAEGTRAHKGRKLRAVGEKSA